MDIKVKYIRLVPFVSDVCDACFCLDIRVKVDDASNQSLHQRISIYSAKIYNF